MLAGGDCEQLIGIIKALFLHQKAQQEKGKKLHSADEQLLKSAERLLYGEFAFALGIGQEEVLPLIARELGGA